MSQNKYEKLQFNIEFTLVSKKPLGRDAWSKIVNNKILPMFSSLPPRVLRIETLVLIYLCSGAIAITPDDNHLSAVVQLEHLVVLEKGDSATPLDEMSEKQLGDMLAWHTMYCLVGTDRVLFPDAASKVILHWSGFTIPVRTFSVGPITFGIEVAEAQIEEWWEVVFAINRRTVIPRPKPPGN